MYDEKDNRYLDCVNNVTHGRCCVILYYFIWFWVFWLYQCMVFNYSTLGFISLQSVIFPVTKRLFYSEAWGELVLIQTSLYFTMNLNCSVILLTTSHSKLAQVIGYLDICVANLRFLLANAKSDWTCWLGSYVTMWNIKTFSLKKDKPEGRL